MIIEKVFSGTVGMRALLKFTVRRFYATVSSVPFSFYLWDLKRDEWCGHGIIVGFYVDFRGQQKVVCLERDVHTFVQIKRMPKGNFFIGEVEAVSVKAPAVGNDTINLFPSAIE